MKHKYPDKRSRFIGTAEMRTNKILHLLRGLGNCSNRNLYKYFPKDIDKIFEAIDEEVRKTKSLFKYKSKLCKEFTL